MIMITIKNDFLTASVDTVGAELVSLINKADGTEYLWQGDPTYWTGHAYNLFPICGRLWEGKYTYQGKTYDMNLHGFARKTAFALTEQTYTLNLHTDCTLTFDGAATVSYKEVVRDYAPLIPAAYAEDEEPLHFNLWMTTSFNFQ